MPLLAGLGPLGVPELLIIAFIIVLIFGVGRLPEVGGAVGKGIREFRKSAREDADGAPDGGPDASTATAPTATSSAASTLNGTPAEPAATDVAPSPAASSADMRFCSECGARNPRSSKFCAECGNSMQAAAR